MARDLGYLEKKLHTEIQSMVEEIHRLIGGLMKSSTTKS
ncbi:hypothetical protein COU15_02730 [Candidatus Kaiserbacteria bacterium CG10_big_fil_rev_8_21_14_0_10_45_20]|uniref:Uncharacterized protein n=1 Tax=Candidatus Kaiserbacteria bacterium CG10_big_fil_rev_8_21_14_0_10_45_20 TaxID=1974607 RepID=A0A2H0UF67_9BACT|nr:MAG: hypothetical protein COU15_02730 [Candidatus Kaiserbacteria bacterium CG10_big_fil_rev_8_21_14_0_10_45_20]